jgi:hypothetical protein
LHYEIVRSYQTEDGKYRNHHTNLVEHTGLLFSMVAYPRDAPSHISQTKKTRQILEAIRGIFNDIEFHI